MKQKRTSVISKARLKNLIQYQGLSEEELEEKYQELLAEAAMDIEEDQEELEVDRVPVPRAVLAAVIWATTSSMIS